MPPESLTFACPICDVRLTVPISLAGVVGPCPSCRARIQAPALPTALNLPQNQIPVRRLEPTTPLPSPAGPASPLENPADPRPSSSPQQPLRTQRRGPIGKPISKTHQRIKREKVNEPSFSSATIFRMVIPLIFLCLATGLVFAVLQIVHHQKINTKAKAIPLSPEPTAISPSQNPSLPPVVEPDESVPVAPPPSEALTPPDLSSHRPALKASDESLKILQQFLDANTLAERLFIIEGSLPPSELSKTCLAAPLRARRDISMSIVRENPIERSVDYFYNVAFTKEEGEGTDYYEVLVRKRGEQSPKVLIDSFLDLYGGRLQKFAASPTEKTAYFQVLVSALPNCYDPNIPNYDRKMSLKLGSYSAGREIATAYAGKESNIGEMLRNKRSGLRVGNFQHCTIMLSWNKKDDPQRPYMEANAIKSLTWNP